MVLVRRSCLASSMIEAVLFDFGGTLVQPQKSWPDIRREARALANETKQEFSLSGYPRTKYHNKSH